MKGSLTTRAQVRRSLRAAPVLGILAALVMTLSPLVTRAATTYQLQLSIVPDRSAPSMLEGAAVSGEVYIFVAPESGVSQVRFWLDNPAMSGTPHRVEKKAPWDFAGTRKDGLANPFDTTTLTDGSHVVTVEITLSGGGTKTLSSTFTVGEDSPGLAFSPSTLSFSLAEGGAASSQATDLASSDATPASFTVSDNATWLSVSPESGTTPMRLTVTADPSSLAPGTYTATATAAASASGHRSAALSVTLTVASRTPDHHLRVSESPDRSASTVLDSRTVAGAIYVFLAPESGVSRVRFWLDDPQMSGSPRQVEKLAPWDFAGTKGTDAAPFDTTTIPEGSHAITASVDLSGGGTRTVHATFNVRRPNALQFTPASMTINVEEGGAAASSTAMLETNAGTSAYSSTDDALWLTATPSTGSTPATITITVDPAGLAPGTYTGTVTAVATDFADGTLAVTMVVGDTEGCSPLACSLIKVDMPYDLDFSYDHGKIHDASSLGTGFTHVDPPSAGGGYLREKLAVDTAAGTLDITTTSGLAYTASNSQDNALGVGIDAPGQVSLISTTLVNPAAGTGNYEQAGLWFGNDEDNHVKLAVTSAPSGVQVEYLLERSGSAVKNFKVHTGSLSGANVVLKLRADPKDKTITASVSTGPGTPQTIGTFVAPGEFFSFDAAGIDPRIGTRTFTGVFTSHRNGPAPVIYRFDNFTVGAEPKNPPPTDITFTRSSIAVTNPTSMVWGPDDRLYVTELGGTIRAYTFNAAKEVTAVQAIGTLGSRLALGITVDPSSTPTNVILWVAHSQFSLDNGEPNSSTVTKLSGTSFLTREDVITGLPRAKANHAVNSIHFGPDGRLYIAQGGNTGAGAPNTANTEFGDRPEQPLSAALLVADVRAAGFDGSCASPLGEYPPVNYCDVKTHATGLRNTYDFVFHSNGSMYAPDNGLGVTGTFPPKPTPVCTGLADPASWTNGGHNPGEQPDNLNRIEAGGYYGHPNPYRDECVFRDGRYQNVSPPTAYRPPIHNLGNSRSANGIIEYRGTAFCGELDRDLLITNYSVGDDITRIRLAPDGSSVVAAESLVGGFRDPLPLVQSPDGTLFVGEFGASKLTILRPDDTGCWTSKAPLPVDLLDAGGTVLDGKLYVLAGKSAAGYRRTLYAYDAATDIWMARKDLPAGYPAVENPAVAAHDGKLYAFGGSTAAFSGAVANAAVYDPLTDTWTELPPLSVARSGAAAQSLAGKIYVAGGMDGTGASVDRVDVYTPGAAPGTGTWSTAPSMGTRRDNPGAAVVAGKLYVFGGRTRNADGTTVNGTLDGVEAYDPMLNVWMARTPMPTGRRTMGTAVLNGRVLLVGGEVTPDGGAFDKNEEYDPASDTWRTLKRLPIARHGAVVGTLGTKVHVVSGGVVGGFSTSKLHDAFSFAG